MQHVLLKGLYSTLPSPPEREEGKEGWREGGREGRPEGTCREKGMGTNPGGTTVQHVLLKDTCMYVYIHVQYIT